MSNKQLRWITLIGAVCISCIMVMQGYWFREAYRVSERQFQHHINMALKAVAENVYQYNKVASPANHLVKTLTNNYYIVMTNSPMEPNLLENWLKIEFRKRDIQVDFEFVIYDCMEENIVYSKVVSMQGENLPSSLRGDLAWNEEDYYFGVYFPGRKAEILGQMPLWWMSSALLIFIAAYFAYLIWAVFRQKILSEVQKDFVANMTHEFKTPLATIALSAQMLEKIPIEGTSDKHRKFLRAIQEEASRLQRHVEHTLLMSRDDIDAFRLKPAPVPIAEVLVELSKAIQANPLYAELTISINNFTQTDKILAEPFHIENIFFNLIDNAYKYNHNQKKVVQIDIYESKECIKVSVVDNGIGIPKEQLKYIFDKFYRIGTGDIHDQKGFGLGLYYVNQMVKAHRGKISVFSPTEGGTVFEIELPKA